MRRQVQGEHGGSRYQAELWELLRAHTVEDGRKLPTAQCPCLGGISYPAHMSIPTIQVTKYPGHLEPEVKIVFVPGALKPRTWMASTLFAPGVSTFPICHPHYACGRPLPQKNIGCVKNPNWAPCERCHSCPLFSLLGGSEPSTPPQYHQGHLSVSTKRSLFILPPDSILSCHLYHVG